MNSQSRAITFYNDFNEFNIKNHSEFISYIKNNNSQYNAIYSVHAHIHKAKNEIKNDFNNLIDTVETKFHSFDRNLLAIDQSLLAIHQEQVNTNILLENIEELLQLPDSEKQRYMYIKRGLKFSNQALKNDEIAVDARDEFESALKLMPQDWFVLQQLAILYLCYQSVSNIEKAKEYFLRSAKYASVESSTGIFEFLNSQFSTYLPPSINSIVNGNGLDSFVIECYLNTALISYVQSDFESAIDYSMQALSIDPNNGKVLFLLAKYMTRKNKQEAFDYFKRAVEVSPSFCIAVQEEKDLQTIPNISTYALKYINDFYERLAQVLQRLSEIRDIIDNPNILMFDNNFNFKNQIDAANYLLQQTLLVMKEHELFSDCARHVVNRQNSSTSHLRRVFHLEYNEASNIMDELEREKIVGPFNGYTQREIFYTTSSELEIFLSKRHKRHTLFEGYLVKDLYEAWDTIKAKYQLFKLQELEIEPKEIHANKVEVPKPTSPTNSPSCFIATAAIGNENHPLLKDLRYFRDNRLNATWWGLKFIKIYNLYGPKLASVISQKQLYRNITFWIIVKPLHYLVKNHTKSPLL